MSVLGELVVKIVADTKQYNQSLKTAKVDASKFARDVGKTMSKFGKSMTMFVTAPILGIGAAMIKTASDAEEMRGKFNAVFKDESRQVEDWAKTFAESINRSTEETMGFLAAIQDTFVPLGFARDAASDMSKTVVTLAEDMASFNNLPTADVMRDMQSAIVGNHETVRKYGVIITEATLNQELMNMGLEDGVKAATEQQKVAARLSIIIKGTSDAHGDAARTSESFANQMRGLKAAIKSLMIEFGGLLLPAAKDMVATLRSLVQRFQDLTTEQKEQIIKWAKIAAIIGPLMIVMGKFLLILGNIAPALTAIKGGLTKLYAVMIANPYVAVIAGVAALTVALVLLAKATTGTARAERALKRARDEDSLLTLEQEKLSLELDIERMDKQDARYRKRVDEQSAYVDKISKQTGIFNKPTAAYMTQQLDKLQRLSEELKTVSDTNEELGKRLTLVKHGLGEIQLTDKQVKELEDELAGIEAGLDGITEAANATAESASKIIYPPALPPGVPGGPGTDEITEDVHDYNAAILQFPTAIHEWAEANIALEPTLAEIVRNAELLVKYSEPETMAVIPRAMAKWGEAAAGTLPSLREIVREAEKLLAIEARMAAKEAGFDTGPVDYDRGKGEVETTETQQIESDKRTDIMAHELTMFYEALRNRGSALKDAQAKEKAAWKEHLANLSYQMDLWGQSIGNLIGALSNLWGQYYQNIIDSEHSTAKEKKAAARDLAKSNRNVAIFQTSLDTASAIIRMLADPGGIAGVVLSIIAGITGAVQIAAVTAQPLPALAAGGVAQPKKGGTAAIIGEGGVSEAILPLTAAVMGGLAGAITEQMADMRRGAGAGNQTHITLELDGQALDTHITKASDDGNVIINQRAVV